MNKLPVLDDGYVSLVDHFGSDISIIEAARMSTNKGFEGWEKDGKLLRFLWENKHHTPFEMAGMTIEVKAPIMVFREWHRHRTQSYNEMSARYVPLPDENYIPEPGNVHERANAQTGNKQAQGTETKSVTTSQVELWLSELQACYQTAQNVYELGLSLGIPKELARLPVPVARYSRMRASANLRNWLGFLKLRMAPNAQWEIRQYANAVGGLVADLFPRTWELFKAEI